MKETSLINPLPISLSQPPWHKKTWLHYFSYELIYSQQSMNIYFMEQDRLRLIRDRAMLILPRGHILLGTEWVTLHSLSTSLVFLLQFCTDLSNALILTQEMMTWKYSQLQSEQLLSVHSWLTAKPFFCFSQQTISEGLSPAHNPTLFLSLPNLLSAWPRLSSTAPGPLQGGPKASAVSSVVTRWSLSFPNWKSRSRVLLLQILSSFPLKLTDPGELGQGPATSPISWSSWLCSWGSHKSGHITAPFLHPLSASSDEQQLDTFGLKSFTPTFTLCLVYYGD